MALYRKYRSANFDEVLGQDHVVKSITAALASGRFAHAYLFTGPRGTGKTSVARLVARALNCTGDPKPCNACLNCLAAINSSLDVIEIDAASNRSIDSIRDLRDKVGLAPTQGKFKVYIIDEVHMLTGEAFNALLKTLEEPPAHAVFIMATTESHKVPETIISRTQRFAFRPIAKPHIIAHLGDIAQRENITIEPDALDIIAAAARGGFRDAISLLDQVAGDGSAPVTAASVRAVLGYTNSEELLALSRAILAGDAAAALQITNRLESSGSQSAQVAIQLSELWRAVLGAAAGLPAADADVEGLAKSITPARAATIVDALLEVSRSPWPALALEVAVVKLAAPDPSLVAPAAAPAPDAAVAKATRTAPTAKPAARETKPATAPAPAATSDGQLNAGLWPKVLVLVKSQNNSLSALLQMYPVDFGDGEVTIKPRFNFHRDLFMKPANRSLIEAAATKVYGVTIKVSARTEDNGKAAPRRQPDPSSELVSSALEILGGEIVE